METSGLQSLKKLTLVLYRESLPILAIVTETSVELADVNFGQELKRQGLVCYIL